jgi:hypothetical protein
LVNLPMEWLYGGALIGGGLGVFLSKVPDLHRPFRWGFAAMCIAMGACFVFMATAIGPDRIVLTESTATYSSATTKSTVPREGLRVHALRGSRGWWKVFNIRDWYSWSSFSSNDLGPDVAGFDQYWGPHGLVRGDQLGKHLADWAGTQPIYR